MYSDEIILDIYQKHREEKPRPQDSEYRDISERYEKLYNRMSELVPGEKNWELSKELDSIMGEWLAYEGESKFFEGFKIGVRLMAGILADIKKGKGDAMPSFSYHCTETISYDYPKSNKSHRGKNIV